MDDRRTQKPLHERDRPRLFYIASRHRRRVEQASTNMAAGLLLMKLVAVLLDLVTTLILIEGGKKGAALPCIWDALHLAEQGLKMAESCEPIIYLLILPDLRREFRQVFRTLLLIHGTKLN